MNLRLKIATIAQSIYDEWNPLDEYSELGNGGICDLIASQIEELLTDNEIQCIERLYYCIQ